MSSQEIERGSYEETQVFQGPWYAALEFSEPTMFVLLLVLPLCIMMNILNPRLGHGALLASVGLYLVFFVPRELRRWRGNRLVIRCAGDALEVLYGPPPGESFCIPYGGIARWEVMTYSPLNHFGHGQRLHHGRRFLTLSGKRAVKLVLTDGRKYVLGSQHPEELALAISEAVGLCGGTEAGATDSPDVRPNA